MLSKGFTDEESKNAGIVKRVQRIAGCKETHEAACQAVLAAAAAAQITLHTTKIPKDITTTDITVSLLSDNSTDSPPTSKRKQPQGTDETSELETQRTPHQLNWEQAKQELIKKECRDNLEPMVVEQLLREPKYYLLGFAGFWRVHSQYCWKNTESINKRTR